MNKLFKFALAALPMVMLASCAKDDLGVEPEIAQKTETRYLKVTLSNANVDPGTRAINPGDGTHYADGTEAENKIRTLQFYFYDRAGQFHSHVPMAVVPSPVADPTVNPRPDEHPNIKGFYHCNVPVELTQGATLPSYVTCIVNAVEPNAYQGSTVESAQKKTLDQLFGNPQEGETNTYFGMSNSVYYGIDPVKGSNESVLIMAAPFTADKLLTETDLEKLEELAAKPGEHQNDIEDFTINIPVERYAVKVNLDLKSLAMEGAIADYPTSGIVETNENVTNPETGVTTKKTVETKVELRFHPKKWGANATEKTFYFLKSFRQPLTETDEGNPTGASDIFATEAQMNKIIDPTKDWKWNNSDHKRSFWARTPGYYHDSYPITADDIQDGGEYDLKYKTWAECADVANVNDALAEYVMETTMKQTRLTGTGMPENYLPTASLPSVILLGHYEVITTDESGNEIKYPLYDPTKPENERGGTDFYLYGRTGSNNIVYSNPDEPIEGTQDIKSKFFNDQTIILKNVSDDPNKPNYVPIYASDFDKTNPGDAADLAMFTVAHPSKEVRELYANTNAITAAKLRIAADLVTLQLGGVPNRELWFYNPNEGKYQPITNTNLNHVNLLLYQNLGGAHYYKDGMAFFSAPIQHWGWHRANNPNVGTVEVEETDAEGNKIKTTRAKTMADWDWKAMKTGDFGLVRNHVYTMKIGKISGLGTAISDEEIPIVPPAEKVKYAVHFHVNIQRWAVLPTQEWNW